MLQCIWWGRGKTSLLKKQAKINYLLKLLFVSADCAQCVANRLKICLYLEVP